VYRSADCACAIGNASSTSFYADFILMANVLSGLLNELSVEFNGLKVAL